MAISLYFSYRVPLQGAITLLFSDIQNGTEHSSMPPHCTQKTWASSDTKARKWVNTVCWYAYESLSSAITGCLYPKAELQSLWQPLGDSKCRSSEGYSKQARDVYRACPILKGDWFAAWLAHCKSWYSYRNNLRLSFPYHVHWQSA